MSTCHGGELDGALEATVDKILAVDEDSFVLEDLILEFHIVSVPLLL
jgi:hypothetical protein